MNANKQNEEAVSLLVVKIKMKFFCYQSRGFTFDFIHKTGWDFFLIGLFLKEFPLSISKIDFFWKKPATKNVLLPPLGRWFGPRRQQHFSPFQTRWDNRDKNYGVTRDRTIDHALQLTTNLTSSHKGKRMKMFIYCLGFKG